MVPARENSVEVIALSSLCMITAWGVIYFVLKKYFSSSEIGNEMELVSIPKAEHETPAGYCCTQQKLALHHYILHNKGFFTDLQPFCFFSWLQMLLLGQTKCLISLKSLATLDGLLVVALKTVHESTPLQD